MTDDTETNQNVAVDVDNFTLRNNKLRNDAIKNDNVDLLFRTVRDAGRWAFGTVFVEVWALNEDGTKLFRPDGGWWLDENYHMASLSETTLDDLIPAAPLAMGEGLAGVLWAESVRVNPAVAMITNEDNRNIVWREVNPIANDPDQPHNPRLKTIAKAGLGLAAAVPFNIRGTMGIVVYLARETCNQDKLKAPSNERYLRSAATLIGAAYAIRAPHTAAVLERKKEARKTFVKAVENLKTMKRLEGSSSMSVQGQEETDYGQKFWNTLRYKVLTIIHKFKGGGVAPPPSFTTKQALVTFVGAFSTLLALTSLNKKLTDEYGGDGRIVLGPFGALMTLQYGLTAAPASQPRNAIMGQLIAISIAIGVSHLNWELWLRQSLATALAITAMVKFGITHPPAGAAALIFSSGHFNWANLGTMLLGNVIAIVTATVINNLDMRRQYPTFYGISPLFDIFKKEKKDEQLERIDTTSLH
mmetsp:Transcript_29533/g.45335  ORF Transcript_29533/g.45335 Transcript_29533/m.45335 type:complete len:472 (-) Transcript_29533:269-1684(-)|eukprot:CAMPEP_0195303466 /NCGR_PEP_ID=MMETSP0707-20130614/32841_1 /TAXON_ID=33640 /ORGANISM="Asterionellopsis glacialis, Strain CCMP134" /LENGTH=471 /DNA_ID=CAMNT_0040367023 /DNA_START=111 /DNA_END=1526 /DNA_ORIENTATION=-